VFFYSPGSVKQLDDLKAVRSAVAVTGSRWLARIVH
jgi:hypothetical protein